MATAVSACSAAVSLLLLAAAIQAASGAVLAKRSLSALARTSQLPHSSTAPADQAGHDQEHGGPAGQGPGQHDKRSAELQEVIREELLRQRAAPATEALLSAIMAEDQYGSGDNGVEDKRSVSSLARYGNLPARLAEEKRSLSSLARYGNLPAPAAPADKRSLEALARGGLLTKNTRIDANGNKRSVAALARAGELPGKRWLPPHQREQKQDLLDVLQRELEESKRSLSSLARSGDLNRGPASDNLPFPLTLVEDQVKRSLESLARNWDLPQAAPKRSHPYSVFDLDDDYNSWGKRNAAALLRQTKFSTNGDGSTSDSQRDEDEHQGQGRRKRSLWDEDLTYGEVAYPYVQSTAGQEQQDWGEPMWSPSAWGAYFGIGEPDGLGQPQQKRFLGRIPNMGRHRQKTNEDSSPRRRRPH